MLERIILTSSNSGDTVLGCYAGSGGTLLQAYKLGRRFIGMDDSESAQEVIERPLQGRRIGCCSLVGPNGPLRSVFTSIQRNQAAAS